MLTVYKSGEFGIVYRGYLVSQYNEEVVAIKTVKGMSCHAYTQSHMNLKCTWLLGFIDDSAVGELLSECAKMKDFDYLHVMTLKGVCLDGGPVPFIILPYMANGDLLSYLKKERHNLVVKDAVDSDDSDEEIQSLVSTWLALNITVWFIVEIKALKSSNWQISKVCNINVMSWELTWLIGTFVGTFHKEAANGHVLTSGQRHGIPY